MIFRILNSIFFITHLRFGIVEVLRLVTAPMIPLAKNHKAYRRKYIIEDVFKEMKD